jgi:hypothetical protein
MSGWWGCCGTGWSGEVPTVISMSHVHSSRGASSSRYVIDSSVMNASGARM